MKNHNVDLIIKAGADGHPGKAFLMFERTGVTGEAANKIDAPLKLSVHRKTGIARIHGHDQSPTEAPLASFSGTQGFLSDLHQFDFVRVMDVAQQLAFRCSVEIDSGISKD